MANYANTNAPANQHQIVQQLVDRWNTGELNITDEQANKLSRLAAEYGFDFDSESNPLGKGLFDLVDTAALGFVPNEWRPTTVGEDYHGESFGDKVAGGAGTVAGLATGFGLMGKLFGAGARGAGRVWGAMRGGASGADDVMHATSKAKELMARKRATDLATAKTSLNPGSYGVGNPVGYGTVNPVGYATSGPKALTTSRITDPSRLLPANLRNRPEGYLDPAGPPEGLYWG